MYFFLQERSAHFRSKFKNNASLNSTNIKNKQKIINFAFLKKPNSVLIQNDEILIGICYLNCNDFDMMYCCALLKQLKKFMTAVQIEKNSLLLYYDAAIKTAKKSVYLS